MARTFQYQAWAEPHLPKTTPGVPAGIAEFAVQNADPPKPIRRQTVDTTVHSPAPPSTEFIGTDKWQPPIPDPTRRVSRLTDSNATAIIPLSGTERTTPDKWLPRSPDRPRAILRLVPEPADFFVSVVAPQVFLSWSRVAEYPYPPKRLPPQPGTIAPDLRGDYMRYEWARGLPIVPARKRPRLASGEAFIGPLTHPIITVGWLREMDRPHAMRRRSVTDPPSEPVVRQAVPVWFMGEFGQPRPHRVRLPIQGGSFAPDRLPDVRSPFLDMPVSIPFRKRVRFEPAETRFDFRGPAVPFVQFDYRLPASRPRARHETAEMRFDFAPPTSPPLAWFVQHFMPRVLGRRATYDLPFVFADLSRLGQKIDDRDGAGGGGNNRSLTGGSLLAQTGVGNPSQ